MVSKNRGPGAVVGNTEVPKKKNALVKSKPDNSQATCRAQRKNLRSTAESHAGARHTYSVYDGRVLLGTFVWNERTQQALAWNASRRFVGQFSSFRAAARAISRAAVSDLGAAEARHWLTARGYSSLSFLYGAAQAIKAKKKPAHIYHFGDLDPSGVDASRDIEAKLKRYAPDAEIHFDRPAATREQVEQWNLPTRRTKPQDPRAKKFVGTSVELDAIPAAKLRKLVRECIERHVDKQQLALLRIAEQSEREILSRWAGTLRGSTVPAEREEAPE
jgi:hypothetical protein